MATFDELTNEAFQIKMNAVKRLVSVLLGDFKSMEPEVIRKLMDLGFSDGKIKSTKSRAETVRQILNVIESVVGGPVVDSAVRGMFTSIDEINLINAQIHQQLNSISDISAVVGRNRADIIRKVSESMFGVEYRNNFVLPLQKGLTQRVMTGIGFNQLESYLAQQMGNSPWVRFAAFNAVQQYDGAINEAIADEFKLNAYRYVGSLIEDSRPQCRRWVGKEVIKREDLNSELEWARMNGSGIVPATNEINFARFRGGYNCRHQAYPIRIDE